VLHLRRFLTERKLSCFFKILLAAVVICLKAMVSILIYELNILCFIYQLTVIITHEILNLTLDNRILNFLLHMYSPVLFF